MARGSGSQTQTEGNKKITANYSVDTSGFGFSIITDDIRNDFNFLTGDMYTKLDEASALLKTAAENQSAFYVDGSGGSVTDLSLAQQEIDRDINTIKTNLQSLRDAIDTAIDQVNAELEYNFGWIIIGETKGAVRTEEIPESDNK